MDERQHIVLSKPVMKRLKNPLISIAAPLLIFIALLAFFQRNGRDRVQTLPALLVGTGLIVSGALFRRRHRRKLLLAIRQANDENEN